MRLPGALGFCAAALLARSGGSMMGIGIVLMVSGLYGSYGWAGAVVAANVVAWALGTAVLSNLVDRYGQRRIMLPANIVGNLTLLLLVWAGVRQAPLWVLFVPAVICGFTGGSAGAMVRARWNEAVSSARELHTAFSLESTLDEVTYIVGPVLAAWLATSVHPAAGLVVPAVVGLVGSFLFYHVLVASQPPVRPREPGQDVKQRFILSFGGMAVVVGVMACTGMAFGAIDVSTVAATTEWGARHQSGLVLAAMSAGSALAGLAYGLRSWSWPLWKRLVSGLIAFALLLMLLLAAHSVAVLALCGFIAGSAVAPSLVNGNSMVGVLVPMGRLTEGLAWIGTAIGVGASIGASVAGQLIDVYGYGAGYGVTVIAAAIAALLVIAGARSLRRHSVPGSATTGQLLPVAG